ncbi:hypothetical protein SCB71_03565 [Herbiconiux sp. KACC 21604]|nr:hypothetical protein [Herbiconiux sp. SALV-R1]WPO87329.1 hypothetical protein SCB71_03565 [Herbiconiux sp. KACC 21604]
MMRAVVEAAAVAVRVAVPLRARVPLLSPERGTGPPGWATPFS